MCTPPWRITKRGRFVRGGPDARFFEWFLAFGKSSLATLITLGIAGCALLYVGIKQTEIANRQTEIAAQALDLRGNIQSGNCSITRSWSACGRTVRPSSGT